MKFGICTAISNASAVEAAGWDYIEENIQSLLRGTVADTEWSSPPTASLAIPAGNSLVPAAMKITGPQTDSVGLKNYLETVFHRAQQLGMKILVFGSGGARAVPNGFDHATARKQILDFLQTAADLAAEHGITLVAEALNRRECNIINSIPEAMKYVKALNHPHFQCLIDTYHFWLEDEPLENLNAAMPWIKHVHVADKVGRVAPGLSDQSDYRPIFQILRQGGYDGLISFEGTAMTDFEITAPKVLAFIKDQWNNAL